jgi:putative PEP-CTERM system TPR-repeat lipoprotein
MIWRLNRCRLLVFPAISRYWHPIKLDSKITMTPSIFLRINRIIAITVILFWPLSLLAMDSGDYVRDAQSYFDKGEYDAAVIQLKNALLADPENGQARLLLGKAYLKLEEGPSAQKELSRAMDLGVSRETVLEPLGRALLMSGMNDELLKRIFVEASDSKALKVDILLLQGQAYLALQSLEMSDDKFSRVLALDSKNAEALLGKARIAHYRKDPATVSELVDNALSIEPDNADAWTLKGELLRAAGQPQEALTAFQKALDSEPGNVYARLGKASALIVLGEPSKAMEDIKLLEEKYSQLYLVNYLKALALFQQQQLDLANESVQQALRQAPNHLYSHLLAGTIAYQMGQMNQAESHLRLYVSGVPDNPQAIKLLATTLIKLKEPAQAIEVMEPGVSTAANDAQYLALLGSAYLARGDASRGDVSKGIEYMEKAIALEPDMAALRTQLAIGQMVEGDLDQAVSELQAAVKLGQGLFRADLMLVLVYLQKKDYDNALTAAEALAVKMPDNPAPLNMKGAALLGKGDQQGAIKAFEAALGIQPDFLPAHLNLAQVDVMSGDTAAAKVRYKKVLSYDASNMKALLALATLAESAGQINEAEKWLKKAYKNHPGDNKPAEMLVEYYLRQGDETQAMDFAREMTIARPRDPNALRLQAMVQLRAGDEKAAMDTLKTLIEVTPRSPNVYFSLATIQLKQKQRRSARDNLQKALQLKSDYPVAQMTLGRLDIAEKDFDAALAIASALQKAHPDAAYGDELVGDVYLGRKEYPQAEAAYVAAYGKTPSAHIAKKIYHARNSSGESEGARQALRDWLARQPDDADTRMILATSLQIEGMNSEAIDEYLLVLKHDPDNLTTLNNIAWLYQEAGNPAGLSYAERAHELAPDRPEVTDTLGWLLVQNGDINRGLLLLQEAAVKAPHMPDIRYHMVVALDMAGRRGEARKELNRLLKSGVTFADIDKARALRDQWGG